MTVIVSIFLETNSNSELLWVDCLETFSVLDGSVLYEGTNSAGLTI